MSDDNHATSPTDDTRSVQLDAAVVRAEYSKAVPRGIFRAVRGGLSQEDLLQPAVGRLLIDILDRQDQRCAELEEVARQHADLREKYAALRQSGSAGRWFEILSSVCLTVGSVGIGAAPSYISSGAPGVGWIIVGCSGGLVLASLVARTLR